MSARRLFCFLAEAVTEVGSRRSGGTTAVSSKIDAGRDGARPSREAVGTGKTLNAQRPTLNAERPMEEGGRRSGSRKSEVGNL
jgi:hypothetical protein